MALTPEETETARRLSWETGILRHLLIAPQHEPYDLFYTPKLSRRDVWVAGRRCRKSALLMSLHAETCIRTEGVQTAYVAPVESGIEEYIKPILQTVFNTCPTDLLPAYRDSSLIYPNESRTLLKGCNMRQYRYMRGQKLAFASVDEMATIDDLQSAVDDVLFPAVWDSHGRMVLSGTPPPIPSPDNPVMRYVAIAKAGGAYWHASVYEAGYTADQIAEALRETSKGAIGERESYEIVKLCDPANGLSIPTIYGQAERLGVSKDALTVFLREFMAEYIRDESVVIVPEFNETDHVRPAERPAYYDLLYKASGADLGVAHKTVEVFGWYDFPRGKVVIASMFWLQGADVRTDNFARAHWDCVRRLGWGNAKRESFWSDNSNLMLINDLAHGVRSDKNPEVYIIEPIAINPTDKENLAEWLNLIRILFRNNGIEIDPSCTLLIATLNGAFWKDAQKKDFGESPLLGHMDALAAAIYFVRNLNRELNPFPANYDIVRGAVYDPNLYVYPQGTRTAQTAEGRVLARVFDKSRRIKPSTIPLGGL